jgi:hypothetical protein
MHLSKHGVIVLALSAVSSIWMSGCGGGGSTSFVAPAPAFSTAPATVAVEGNTYSYMLAATDPSGGTVGFALTTAPDGATLSGSTISWTPSAAESRVGNAFTVTATTSKGGTATQSWTVTPNGTVRVAEVNTYWGPGGATTGPTISWSASAPAAAVLVQQPDGLFEAIYGSGDSNGVLSFQNVPAGHFWLSLGAAYYWTSSSNIDFGTDIAEASVSAPPLPSSTTSASFTLNLTGLDATTDPSLVEFSTVPGSLGLVSSAPTSNSFTWSDDPALASPIFASTTSTIQTDVTQVHDGFFWQEEPAALGPLQGFVLGPTVTLSGLTLQNGVDNTINATLSPSPQSSLPLKINAAAWSSLFDNVAPTTPTQSSSPFSLQVQPWVIGVNALPAASPLGWSAQSQTVIGATPTTTEFVEVSGSLPIGLLFPAVDTTLTPLSGFMVPGPPSCRSGLSYVTTYTGSVILSPCGSTSCQAPLLSSDTDFGTIQYGDPFPANWQRVFNFCQQALLPLPSMTTVQDLGLGNTETTTYSYNLFNNQSTALPSAPVTPMLSPVLNPTINGASLFTPATLDTRTLTLSWTKPATGAPYGYRVQIVSMPASSINGIVTALATRTFYTAQTSITIPPEMITSGQSYLIDITALMDGKANMESSPRRSALPTAAANVVSAPITISPSAP